MRQALLVIVSADEHPRAVSPVGGADWFGNIVQAMAAAARAGVPIALVRKARAVDRRIGARAHRPERGIPHEILKQHWDILVETHDTEGDLFSQPALVDWLVSNSIEMLTLCGDLTRAGRELTTRHARQFGYMVSVLADATVLLHPGVRAADGGDASLREADDLLRTHEWAQRMGAWFGWAHREESRYH